MDSDPNALAIEEKLRRDSAERRTEREAQLNRERVLDEQIAAAIERRSA